ncbi:hypothetical protein CYMTET_21710 [Cymbomonas tetramitiformis]|uniref:Uncharacterized protein n=1 Tax=Cymbomonas tetramitiformis TaxID=36881 RepID=A0AAE0L2Y7_9CHLO|nr:hypothetical protein CYMTET_21710 [Cymbomonas tetramitiformis]
MVSALMCICAAAAAAPPTDQVFGGVSLDHIAVPGRTVGGAILDYIVPEEFPSTPWTPSIDRHNDFAIYDFWLRDSWVRVILLHAWFV